MTDKTRDSLDTPLTAEQVQFVLNDAQVASDRGIRLFSEWERVIGLLIKIAEQHHSLLTNGQQQSAPVSENLRYVLDKHILVLLARHSESDALLRQMRDFLQVPTSKSTGRGSE